jgi:hypothetical protein
LPNNLINFVNFLLYVIFREETYLKTNAEGLKIPKHIGCIITADENKTNLSAKITQFIKWNLILKKQNSDSIHLNIYDPLDTINEAVVNKLSQSIKSNFDKVLFISGKITYTYNYSDYDLIISILKNSSEVNSIKKILNKEKFIYPCEYEYFEKEIIQDINETSIKNEPEKYFTKKTEKYLPEILFVFGGSEVSFYSYPFTLLENCEIRLCKTLTHFQVDDFLQILNKYNKIEKRWGK